MSWQKRSLSKVIEQIPIGVAVTVPGGAVEYVNPHLRRLLCLDAARLRDAGLEDFRADGSAFWRRRVMRLLLAGKSWQGETRFQTARGRKCDFLESIYPLHDEAGTITHFIHFLQDISALKHIQTLSNLAFYDSLTGLPNRNLFNDRLGQALAAARRDRSGFALLLIDIDHFKRVNDTLGHDAGDELLCRIAARLRQSLRKIDTVARVGGDEFAAILERVTDARLAAKTAEKLLAACGGDYKLRGGTRRVTLSIGISLYPRDTAEMKDLMKHADAAMYQAKAAGRNGYRLREPHRNGRCRPALRPVGL